MAGQPRGGGAIAWAGSGGWVGGGEVLVGGLENEKVRMLRMAAEAVIFGISIFSPNKVY